MTKHKDCSCGTSRREFLRTGFFGLGLGVAVPRIFGHTSAALAAQGFQADAETHPERILVVVELAGGNDGIDTIIPYGHDAYHRARRNLRRKTRDILTVDDEFAFHPSLGGFKAIWDDGLVAVIHGCGYPNPNRSHFSSMEYWHTAMPWEVESRGWIGRMADDAWEPGSTAAIVNISQQQSLAVQSQHHAPVVFKDPEEFVRAGSSLQGEAYEKLIQATESGNETLDFLAAVSRDASSTSRRVREVIRAYSSPVAYGSTPLALDLRKVAAMIESGFPTRVYYVSLGGFDTHASQIAGRFYLLTGLGEALHAFHRDLRRIGRSKDVLTMMFSEFGRRVAENASQGTDHGTAGPMFLMGDSVKPGFHGEHPSLTELDDNGDLKMTMDFRRVYATALEEWMGYGETEALFKGKYPGLGIVGA